MIGTFHTVLDFDKPIAVLMVALLHFVSDAEDAHGIVAQFVDALAPGSALVVSHASEGHEPGRSGAAHSGWKSATSQLVLLDRGEIERFFEGRSPQGLCSAALILRGLPVSWRVAYSRRMTPDGSGTPRGRRAADQ